MDNPACLTCKFFNRFDGPPAHGECRRRAPKFMPPFGLWPDVHIDDFCGEHRPAEEVEA